jgi:hypothetical protein
MLGRGTFALSGKTAALRLLRKEAGFVAALDVQHVPRSVSSKTTRDALARGGWQPLALRATALIEHYLFSRIASAAGFVYG